MNSSNPTKVQHFVPRFYLKNFADENKALHVLNVKEKRMSKTRPYQGLGYEYYFYAMKTGVPDAIAQHIEDWLKPMEDFISKELPRIITALLTDQQIKDDARYTLSVLMSMLWLRTPGMRSNMKQMEDDLIRQIEKISGPKSAEHMKNTNNVDHLRFMVNSTGFGGPGFANMFFHMKWKAYIGRGKEVFITSDSPVIEKWRPPHGFNGASFLERDKYFALTPQILLHLTMPKGATKVKRKTIYEEQDDKVKALNIILTSGAQAYVYSGNKTCLEQLLAGRKKPGKLEREYIAKYEIPWAAYHAKRM